MLVPAVCQDEWLGLPMDHPATCEEYIRRTVVQPLGVTEDRCACTFTSRYSPVLVAISLVTDGRYLAFDAESTDPQVSDMHTLQDYTADHTSHICSLNCVHRWTPST